MATDVIIAPEKQAMSLYEDLLQQHDLTFNHEGHFLRVGETGVVQGWILHISIIVPQIHRALQALLPVLARHHVPFKIADSARTAAKLLSSDLGYHQLGKIVSIYPEDTAAADLANELITLTQGFAGPDIPTDIHLGGRVYTRFGNINPLIRFDASGNEIKCIYNASGELVADPYDIPFSLPKGITWPFHSIRGAQPQIRPTFIQKYRIVSEFKSSAKGRVLKGLFFKGFGLRYCVIKEAKSGLCVDEAERDMTDRLRWQFKVHNDLVGKVPIPKIYDLITQGRDLFLVMEYIKGQSFKDFLDQTNAGKSWQMLEYSKKDLLLSSFKEIARLISTLHQAGYIHRDVTHLNFIRSHGRFVLIDVELTYSLHEGIPDPPFALGTEGFFPEEQRARRRPTEKEDVYGLGAMLILVLTRLNPAKFDPKDIGKLTDNIMLFTSDYAISNLAARCLAFNPKDRPEVEEVLDAVNAYQERLLQTRELGRATNRLISNSELDSVIERGIRGLTNYRFINPNEPWNSNHIVTSDLIGNRQIGRVCYPGVLAGAAGIVYFISVATRAGAPIDSVKEGYNMGLEFMVNHVERNLAIASPGFFYGFAGVGLAFTTALEAFPELPSADVLRLIRMCFENAAQEVTLSDGVAGQGISLLQCSRALEEQFVRERLDVYVARILASQLRDGSWETVDETVHKRKKFTGLSKGVAGIVYFLLSYYDRYRIPKVKTSIDRALRWLQTNSLRKGDARYWYIHTSKKVRHNGMLDGLAGIALTFLRAFEVTNDLQYRQWAERAMLFFNDPLVSKSFTLAEGSAGIGELYLEAARILGDEVWRNRASWIATMLATTSHLENDIVYWFPEDNKLPTADFLIGNSGILHFLLRYQKPDELGLPLLRR